MNSKLIVISTILGCIVSMASVLNWIGGFVATKHDIEEIKRVIIENQIQDNISIINLKLNNLDHIEPKTPETLRKISILEAELEYYKLKKVQDENN